MTNLFIDSDILLDALLLRQPNDSFALGILSLIAEQYLKSLF
jgi:hypothetical protein